MIIASIAICVIASGACDTLRLDTANHPITSMYACENLGREFLRQNKEKYLAQGYELRDPICHWADSHGLSKGKADHFGDTK